MKDIIETKGYSIRLLPEVRKKANKEAKSNGKTFSTYVNDLITKDLQK